MKLNFFIFILSIPRLDLVSAFSSNPFASAGRRFFLSAIHSTTVPEQGSAINVVNVEDANFLEDWTSSLLKGELVDDDEANVLEIMQVWCQKKSVEGAETVEKILHRIENHVDAGIKPETSLRSYHYAIAINAWAKSGHARSHTKAEEIFHRMEDRGVMVNRVVYNTLMNAYALQKDTEKVKEILNRMEKECPADLQTADYNMLIQSFARRGEAKAAEEVVKNMVDRYYKGETECLPDGVSYNMILDAWAKSDSDNCGTRAEMILDAIEERENDAFVQPNVRSYVTVMWAVIRSGEENVVKRVEAIWERAKSRGIAKDPYVFTAFLEAYATERPIDATKKVAEIIKELEWIDPSKNDKIIVYNAALKLLKESRDDGAPAYAEHLFQRMVEEGAVDHVSYGTMIMMCINREGCESFQDRVEELLTGMEDSGLHATTGVMNSVMNMWVRRGDLTRAAIILNQMEEAYRSGDNDLAPNVVSYTTLMNGWNKSGYRNREDKTQDIFDRMLSMYDSGNESAEPNLVSYVTLVESIVKSKSEDAAERVEEIVRGVFKNYQTGKSSVKPNAQIISTAINCWGQSGDRDAGERAEGLLNWLLDIYQADYDPELAPNEYCFAPGKHGVLQAL
jgi:pentatricopeptide repeat protein